MVLTDESSAPAIHSPQPAWLAGLESSLLILYASNLVKRKSPELGEENTRKHARQEDFAASGEGASAKTVGRRSQVLFAARAIRFGRQPRGRRTEITAVVPR